MNTLIGLIIIAIGSLGQSSSYVPINKVKDWSWENFWLVQGVFAWLVFPFLGALLATNFQSLIDVYSIESAATLKTIFYGVLWGIGGLTFGLSMRYLGVALGQSIALGTCSAFGTLIPAVLSGNDLLSGDGVILLISVCITLAGIATIGYAGSLRSKDMTEEEKKKAVKDFALKKGLLVALLAGVMSACFSLGLNAGEPIQQRVMELGANSFFTQNPVTLLVTIGGFLTNLIYCVWQNKKNGTSGQIFTTPSGLLVRNTLFCVLAGILWYSQFFALGMGKSFFEPGSIMIAFSWSILMSLNVICSNIWGIVLKEWKGTGQKTIMVLILGMAILIFSLVLPNLL
ncbi:L-rhamnose/proton symporter RhaT [Dysgonomonas sp. HDW5A]|uniref:L-rhamnose/proton symporter RhaT n=1 Tax=Dysgonomonas sp. HDW5A TaxID=2714926 RepID=UPI00140BE50B|nr:L-rhamnose/proton symporter RhaT [Dysgonomonas sp. HDW5A]QIK58419.1 L-rhamnose/proton symporter RhaT [Dysgonomonas sp. HDW5A]